MSRQFFGAPLYAGMALMRKRTAARSFLTPFWGRTTYVVGLGALMRKRTAARSFLNPLWGRTTYVVGLGALSSQIVEPDPRAAPPRPASSLRGRAEEVHLAEFDAVMAQQSVSRGDVEVEVRRGVVLQVGLALHRH